MGRALSGPPKHDATVTDTAQHGPVSLWAVLGRAVPGPTPKPVGQHGPTRGPAQHERPKPSGRMPQPVAPSPATNRSAARD
ncbi:hypothetical protein OsI_05372 [Oryza sativa Indica Group]|uniref:Uncharacterized protein n=1 Tax=Oryza sativa subsp. indica TaxID=39946 RepID=B8A9W2_ORYSI|nr:hypothetical protein OsI_05372 [Oryza sativa Indica Group]